MGGYQAEEFVAWHVVDCQKFGARIVRMVLKHRGGAGEEFDTVGVVECVGVGASVGCGGAAVAVGVSCTRQC